MTTGHEKLEFHPLADLFPMLEGTEFNELVADIKKHGLLNPITLYEGKVLDGRNRYLACLHAGVPIQKQEYTGSDPADFVLSANLHRRHLNESQRAMIAEKLANMVQGARTDLRPSANLPKVSQSEAARKLKVSERSLRNAKVVRNNGLPSLVQRVERGEVTASLAAKITGLPKDEQQNLVHADKRTLRKAANTPRGLVSAMEVVRKTPNTAVVPNTKQYDVIYAAVPWNAKTDTSHYDDPARWSLPAAAECVLFLWAPVPQLANALHVIETWGFIYKSQMVWWKGQTEAGYCTRVQHELLLIAVRGAALVPVPQTEHPSILAAEAHECSSKPDAFADIIGAMFPTLSKVELFARTRRAGWDGWTPQVRADCAATLPLSMPNSEPSR